MAYSSGSTILDDDYNIFVTGNASGTGDDNVPNVNTIWGSGTGNKGYGQPGELSFVSAGITITATQWTNLINRLSTIRQHQGASIGITNPTVGDTITAFAQLNSDISDAFSNRLDAAASGTDITSGGSVSGTTSWYTQAETTTTITFGSASQARYYFNAGGIIRMTPIRSGTNNQKSTSWNTFASNVGTIEFTNGSPCVIGGSNYTGTDLEGNSGTPSILASNTGFYDLTPGGSATTIFKQFLSADYNYDTNFIQLDVSLNSSSTALTFVMTFRDDAADTKTDNVGNPLTQDQVQGTTGSTLVARQPSTTHISNTWGTPTISGSISYITS